ncbi:MULTISPECIES: helix-turn-helix transcriptional regulator [Photorhabdus]|uniref:Helix-turn-helix domain-containing protein n=1 Tax=Photorhabdus kayaii TaxID=230088 RepID=A0ABX0AT50_9GAMM|nr:MULTISPECIES: helix-turn-helix transcriptional regulator [Photorhabdus]MCC8373929.1 helix-turn-helix transcriptional regulator [Photorhabdus bodei]MCC8463423.1 helix-turn-helix transcriptional regulator [Photorhabdus bodei]MDB6367416.1 helix-turn-helix transcriptional regulator [Photorhabdus bodei]NDL10352.1 helix-turn-helix domain-containing protein [Photorhabdus kayaii]NDL23775.1 helix-turn-helix domain-containing protein [Photorhabdus kayaii]
MLKHRAYSKFSKEAVMLLGEQIKLGRKRRHWSEKNLAERAGISRTTLQKIESGDMGCSIGLAFELANLVGINLFDSDKLPISARIEQTRDKLVLLPQRIQEKEREVYDDF